MNCKITTECVFFSRNFERKNCYATIREQTAFINVGEIFISQVHSVESIAEKTFSIIFYRFTRMYAYRSNMTRKKCVKLTIIFLNILTAGHGVI